MTSNESKQLNQWFQLFFNLKESNISLEQLQQFLFDAGFEEPFSEAAKKDLSARIALPEKDTDYGYEIGIIEAIFGRRVRNINVNEPNVDEVCDFTAYLLNSIEPPLCITEQSETWEEDSLKRTRVVPVAKSLLGYEIAIPSEKIALTHFSYNNQQYGFFHSDDLNTSMFIVMRNIDCFLSFLDRPERVFRFKQSIEEIDHFILAEPKKFKALANKLQITILDTLDETEFQSEVAEYDIPPSLGIVKFEELSSKLHKSDQRVISKATPISSAETNKTVSAEKKTVKILMFILFPITIILLLAGFIKNLLKFIFQALNDMPRVMKLVLIGYIICYLAVMILEAMKSN